MARRASDNALMWQRLFVEFEGPLLQGRLQDMLVHAILEGLINPGEPIPSSRQLATMLGVSRSTVTLALQRLCDMRLLVPKNASGYFVHVEAIVNLQQADREAQPKQSADVDWSQRIAQPLAGQRNICKPADWYHYPYPFVYGQIDQTLFPKNDWRQCVGESLQVSAIQTWAPDLIDGDDPGLIEQIQQRLLPARGISTARENILVTAGAQNATYLLAHTLFSKDTTIAMENPGYPDARNIFSMRSNRIIPVAVDRQGLQVDDDFGACDYLFVTPSHQCPTTVTLPLQRRLSLLQRAEKEDFVIIEDDHESELNFAGKPTAALKSLDQADRVIYIGSLSKTLFHGLRLGFLVAPPALIDELRRLRRLIMRHPSSNNQHTAAMFIRHGFQQAYVKRLNSAYGERADILREALTKHLPDWKHLASNGGSALWVETPADLDSSALATLALQHGIVIEPGAVFYSHADKAPTNVLRMGYSAIPARRIEAGVERLAALVRHEYRSDTDHRAH